jgi:hypothetical protein
MVLLLHQSVLLRGQPQHVAREVVDAVAPAVRAGQLHVVDDQVDAAEQVRAQLLFDAGIVGERVP